MRGSSSTLDPPVTIVPGTAYAVHRCDIPHRLDAEVWPRHAARRCHCRVRFGHPRVQERWLQPDVARGWSRYAPEWAWSYEGGLKTALARRPRAAQRRGFSHRLLGPPGADGYPARRHRYLERGRGDHPWCRVRRQCALTRAVHAGGHLAWLDATYDRYIAVGVGGVTGNVAGHRLNNAPGLVGTSVARMERARIGRSRVVSLRADSRWQSTVFFTPFNDTIQRQRPFGLLDSAPSSAPDHRRWSVMAYCAKPHERGLRHRTRSVPLPLRLAAVPENPARSASNWQSRQ